MNQKDNHLKCCKKTSIGGQALMEGIMMRGPEKYAMAVRNTKGELVVEEYENKAAKRPAFCRWLYRFNEARIHLPDALC